MRRIGTILGIALTVTVLISGQALATWYYIDHVDDYDSCTNINNIIGRDDGTHASLGTDPPLQTLGWALLDFGVDAGMDSYWSFTVYANSSIRENYTLRLISDEGQISTNYTHLDDTHNEVRSAPLLSKTGDHWRYVEIWSEEDSSGDNAYGSDIDAIGFETP